METLMLIFWIIAIGGTIGLIYYFLKSSKKGVTEKEIFSGPSETKKPEPEPENKTEDEENNNDQSQQMGGGSQGQGY